MDTIKDAIKYDWVDQLAKDFFYEKCSGRPEDIVADIKELILGVVEAEKELAEERKILESIPY